MRKTIFSENQNQFFQDKRKGHHVRLPLVKLLSVVFLVFFVDSRGGNVCSNKGRKVEGLPKVLKERN